MPRGRTAETGLQTIASRVRSRSRKTKTPSPTTAKAIKTVAKKTTPKKAASLTVGKRSIIVSHSLKSAKRAKTAPSVKSKAQPLQLEWTLDQTFWDRYELQNAIQKGGFGEVYAAKSIADGQKYAIKLLFKMSPDTIQEVELMRAARDDYEKCLAGIVCYVEHAVVEWPQKGGQERRYAIVMGFVQGEDLFDLMNTAIMSGTPTDEKAAKQLFRNALLALAALHTRGIAHRDIKPENIRVVNGNKVVLLDLGLACFKDREPKCRSQKSFEIGTPCYSSSPEIVVHGYKNDKETFSADVYAIAQSFLPLFTGEEPAACVLKDRGVPLGEAITLARRPDSPSALNIVDKEFAQVVYDMLAPTAAERPTAAEAARRLK